MIPARMGSKRVPKKNIRLLAGQPLISYALKSATESGVFDEIYLNSEDNLFAPIAEEYGVSFFQRKKEYATDETNNDEFLYDFINKTSSDFVIQLLPTSPFITSEQIKKFVETLITNTETTLVSVANHKIAGIYNNTPLNFSQSEPHISSQKMTPIQTYATVLMGYDTKCLSNQFKNMGFGYHGEVGKTAYFEIDGLAKIDIDTEEDFQLADFIMKYIKEKPIQIPKYFSFEDKKVSEIDVPSILAKDGIFQSDFENENLPLNDIEEIINNADNSISWCRRIVNTESNSATLISQLPGEGNRLHYHPNWNEWWYIVKGTWEWEVEGKKMPVQAGQMVFIPKNKWHKITAIGKEPAVRLAVSRGDVEHIYKLDQ